MWEGGKGIKHFKYISTISSKLGQGFTSRTDDLYDLYDLFSFHDLDMPGRADIICDIYIYYKVPLREVGIDRGVAQERNEKHPAWNEYHYAGNTSNSSIRIVFDTNINALIHKRTLHFRTGRYLFFCLD